ncbi:MAG: DUF1570 domain-containing protein [Phycisphaerae bacterium]
MTVSGWLAAVLLPLLLISAAGMPGERPAKLAADGAVASRPVTPAILVRPLPADDEAVERLRGRVGDAARTLVTDHFVLVHTTSEQTARAVTRRLEAVYLANVRMVVALGLEVQKPTDKLAVVLHGSYDEFRAAQRAAGSTEEDVLGFYAPDEDCSYFFDLTTYPPIVRLHDELSRAAVFDDEAYRRLRLRVAQRTELLAEQVIQHEAAHHVHRRLRLFGAPDRAPTWLVEGLAQLFELPFVERGASLPLSTNRYRLLEFSRLYGDAPDLPGDIRRIVAGNGDWRGAGDYALSWALTDYLYKRQRQRLETYLRLVAAGERSATEDPQAVFEQAFGPVDEAFVAGLREHVSRVRARYAPRRPTAAKRP